MNLYAPSHSMQGESISLVGHVICSYNSGYILTQSIEILFNESIITIEWTVCFMPVNLDIDIRCLTCNGFALHKITTNPKWCSRILLNLTLIFTCKIPINNPHANNVNDAPASTRRQAIIWTNGGEFTGAYMRSSASMS